MSPETAGSIAVQVRLFADLRDQLGSPGTTLQLPATASVPLLLEALLEELAETLSPPLDVAAARALLTGSNVRVAINQRLAAADAALADGDEVAFLPPVTGG
ncbi:MAG: MoaD/ThiS family protein [Pseudomonadales bacterium]